MTLWILREWILDLLTRMHKTKFFFSDGGGRTGIYLAIVDLIATIESGGRTIDVFRTVTSLMKARRNIIQTEARYW